LFCTLCYLVVPCLLQLVLLRPRSQDFKELEIVVLRHELTVLRRQTHRARLTTTDRVFLAAASWLLSRSRWPSFLVAPTTLLRWQRRLVALPACAGAEHARGRLLRRRDDLALAAARALLHRARQPAHPPSRLHPLTRPTPGSPSRRASSPGPWRDNQDRSAS
jgi:hypothetical protein